MQLSNRWTNKEGWLFWIKDTGAVRRYIDKILVGEEDPDLSILGEMEFKREWMEDHGEGNPPNYEWLKGVADELQNKIISGTFTPGIIENQIVQKAIFYGLTKYKQDTAYRELMGGWLTVTVLDPSPLIAATTKEERVAYLHRLEKWMALNYKRERTKPWVMALIADFIRRYERSEFVEQATDWFYNQLIEYREKWQISDEFNPVNWYPVGRGYVQNKIRGGRG